MVQTVGLATLGSRFLLGVLLVVRKEIPLVVTIIITVTIFCFYMATLGEGTSRIPSLVLRLLSRSFLLGHPDESSLRAWEVTEYMANNLIFLLSGVMVVDLMSSKITRHDILDLLHSYLASLTARGITVLLFYPLLKNTGLGFVFADALVWAGLGRAVGLSIAMIVQFSAAASHPLEKPEARFMFHIGGVCYPRAVPQAGRESPRADPGHDESLMCVIST